MSTLCPNSIKIMSKTYPSYSFILFLLRLWVLSDFDRITFTIYTKLCPTIFRREYYTPYQLPFIAWKKMPQCNNGTITGYFSTNCTIVHISEAGHVLYFSSLIMKSTHKAKLIWAATIFCFSIQCCLSSECMKCRQKQIWFTK